MGFPIPAICERCQIVWLANHLVGGGASAVFTLVRCGAGPCPKCGGMGRIPDGQYTLTGGTLFNASDVRLLLDAVQALQTIAAQGASREEVEEAIESEYPSLVFLKRLLPGSSNEFSALLTAIGVLLTAILPQCSSSEAPAQPPQPVVNVYVPIEISEALSKKAAEASTPKIVDPPADAKSVKSQ